MNDVLGITIQLTSTLILQRELKRLQIKSLVLCDKRAQLLPGSSRAQVTTANARWAQVAEQRDYIEAELMRRGGNNAGL